MTPRTSSAIVAASFVALLAPSAAFGQQDLRSPDNRDAAAAGSTAVQDLRSPDTRDVAPVAVAAAAQDLRSPDARDAGAPAAAAASAPAPVAVSADDGFDWGSAGIGAAGMLGIAVAAIGASMLLGMRRRHQHPGVHRAGLA